MEYMPAPIDTSTVALPAGLDELVEMLSKNVHDVWARQRLTQGWRRGAERNDTRKEHPCLIPYEELSDDEKDLDRGTALESIKAILALGYQIEPPARHTTVTLASLSAAGQQLAAALPPEDPAGRSVSALMALWHARNSHDWAQVPQLSRWLGERLWQLGEPLLAYDVVTEALLHRPDDVRLRQLQGLALAKSGSAEKGNEILRSLRQEGHTDEETLGMLARTHKDLAQRAREPAEREAQLRLAAETYLDAYQRTRGTWTGGQAATLAVFLGERERAIPLARAVREQCLQELDCLRERGDDCYWPLATLGEIALILGEWSEAEDWYAQAAEVGRGQYGALSTTRRNARLLIAALGGDPRRIDRCLRIAPVVAFAGHQIDALDCETMRLSPQLEGAVRDAIRDRLDKRNAGVGYSAAACPSDILFLETILDRDGEAHVILPSDRSDVLGHSGENALSPSWLERYQRVLERAMPPVVKASPYRIDPMAVSQDYVNSLVLGLAALHAEQLETDLVLLAIQHGRSGARAGGFASILDRWRKRGHAIEIIDLGALLAQGSASLTSGSQTPAPRRRAPKSAKIPGFSSQIRAILFADAVGFSKLTEEEVPRFFAHFLGAVADLAARYAPAVKNTWGDGLYFVFADFRDAGLFALELCEMVSVTKWIEKGFREGLGLRIGLHAGPVHECIDPVTGGITCTGAHVSRAARIEPITPPNQIYASEAFAALASAYRVRDFTCDYVGLTPLAKGYGSLRTYHVRRPNP